MLGPSSPAKDRDAASRVPAALQPGTTYYWRSWPRRWRSRRKTSADLHVHARTATPPPPPPPAPAATKSCSTPSKAPVTVGTWQVEQDPHGGGRREMRQPNAGAAKLASASATPANYFELTLLRRSGQRLSALAARQGRQQQLGERFGLRAVRQLGDERRQPRLADRHDLGDRSQPRGLHGCGVSSWGWQDNGWGAT